MKKKTWTKPQLTIISRTEAEAVLFSCKHSSGGTLTSMIGTVGTNCATSNTVTCVACNSTASS